jgi:2-phosphoglycerate kinase
MQDRDKILQHQLTHVCWIGGSPCAGKSSIADILAATYGLSLYRADEAYLRHEKIVTPERHPIFYKLTHCSSEELWMRPVEQQVMEEITLYHEEFSLILDELLALPKSQPILAEGSALLPECVLPFLLGPQRAVWIVPNAEFQLHHYGLRAWAKDVVKDCTNPEQALQNWMQRDIRFARWVEQEALQQGMRVLIVNGTYSLAENTSIVEQHFHPGQSES